MKSIEQKISDIKNKWFFTDPLLFSVVCTHSLVQNDNLSSFMRCGKFCIEYSPTKFLNVSDELLEKYLKIEAYRILLNHPYKRQPYKAQKDILLLSSDVTIYQTFKKDIFGIELMGVEYLKSIAKKFEILDFPFGKNFTDLEELQFFKRNLVINHQNGELILTDELSFEQWYKKIYFLISKISSGGQNAGVKEGDFVYQSDGAELWEENEEAVQDVLDKIKKTEIDNGWGEIGGNERRKIIIDCDFSFDYRKALAHFRSNIVSNSRKLTRMRPSRRYGFKAMGSRYERKANILIAVDVSGSISNESFNHFCHAVKNFFYLRIVEKIDLIFFDVNIRNTTPVTFGKKINVNEIKGSGGTNFLPAIQFYNEHKDIYNGMIIFTDGQGEVPNISFSKESVLWILDCYQSFLNSKLWIEKILGCKSTYLPF